MKKQDLVKVIREIVRQEIKKELPKALTEVFANLMGGAQPKQVHGINVVRNLPPSEPPVPIPQEPVNEMDQWKMQLREMIDGNVAVPQTAQPRPQAPAKPPVQLTKNPLLNEALSQTRPFNSQERFAMRAGGGGAPMMSPAVAMAGAQFGGGGLPETGPGPIMDDSELSFMKNVPGMPGADAPVLADLPPTSGRAAMLAEGQEGGAAPMESLGEVSALDVKNHPGLPDSIKGILNRDYRSLVKAMDKKK